MSLIRIGEDNPFFGKKHTEETKQKISQAHIGFHAGVKNSFFGKHHSPETKLIMKLAYETRKYARQMFMSGRFQTRLGEGMN